MGAGLVSFALGTDTAGSGTEHDSKSSPRYFLALFCMAAAPSIANQLGSKVALMMELSQLQPSQGLRPSKGSSRPVKVWLVHCAGCIFFSADGKHSCLLLAMYTTTQFALSVAFWLFFQWPTCKTMVVYIGGEKPVSIAASHCICRQTPMIHRQLVLKHAHLLLPQGSVAFPSVFMTT